MSPSLGSAVHPGTSQIALLLLFPLFWGSGDSLGLSQMASAIEAQFSQDAVFPKLVIPDSWMGDEVVSGGILDGISDGISGGDAFDPLFLAAPENFNPDLFRSEPESEWQETVELSPLESSSEGKIEPEEKAQPKGKAEWVDPHSFSAESLLAPASAASLLEGDRPISPEPEPLVPLSSETPVSESLTLPAEASSPAEPWVTIEDLQIDYDNNLSNFGQGKQIYEPTLRGRLRDGTPVLFSTGYNRFDLPGFEPVINVPLRVGWQEQFQGFPINISGGIDGFNRLRPAPTLQFSTNKPLGQKAVLSLELTHGLDKFNVETLEKGISSWRYGPSLFWQIDAHTTFFSLVRWGRYSDGNREQQSFSRLEHRRGEFSAALNSFNWRYRHNYEARSGYFSPNDFLVLSAELAWEKNILDSLKCRLAGTLGKQRAGGVWANAYSYDALCTLKPFSGLEIDIGYSLGNVLDRVTGGSAFNNNSIKGQIRLAH